MILCPSSVQDGINFRKFGNNFQISCSLNMTKFFYQKSYKTYFYDLFLRDLKGEYVPIPIKITNLPSSSVI